MNKPLFTTFLALILACLTVLGYTATLTAAAQWAYVLAVLGIIACLTMMAIETGDTRIVLFAP